MYMSQAPRSQQMFSRVETLEPLLGLQGEEELVRGYKKETTASVQGTVGVWCAGNVGVNIGKWHEKVLGR